MSEEAKRREDHSRQTFANKTGEHLKMLADLKRYTFTAFLAVSVATFGADDTVTLYVSTAGSVLLLGTFCVLTIIRYRKIKSYEDG